MIPDEQLAHRLQQGDSAALDPLIARHYDGVFGLLYRMLHGDRALAEDLVQETFLRALRGIGGYAPDRPFKPWLYGIAVNLARDHAAKADTRRVTVMPEDADDDHPAFAVDAAIDAELIAAEQARAVAAALATLPAAQREVVILHFYEGMSLAAIAETLAIPIGTVKSRLSIGTARLRERMRDEPNSQRQPTG